VNAGVFLGIKNIIIVGVVETVNKVRGVLCNQCNVIEGMIRNKNHLDTFYKNYSSYLEEI
jgi:hypothetical protein